MSTTCPKCAYTRTASDNAPEWQCPSCGVAYVKAQKQAALAASPVQQPTDSQHQQWRATAAEFNARGLSHKYILEKLSSQGCQPDFAKQLLDDVHREQNPKNRKGGFKRIAIGVAMLALSLGILVSISAAGPNSFLTSKATLVPLVTLPIAGGYMVFSGFLQVVLG